MQISIRKNSNNIYSKFNNERVCEQVCVLLFWLLVCNVSFFFYKFNLNRIKKQS